MSLILSGDGSITGLTSSGVAGSSVNYLPAGTGAVATTVQAKLRETVSVKDFGAVGDGVTDDTAAILIAQATGKKVLFPSGTYLLGSTVALTSTHNNSGWVLDGATIRKGFNGDLVTITNCTGFTVEGTGTVDGQSATYSGKGFVFSGISSTFPEFGAGITIKDFAAAHIEIGADAAMYFKTYARIITGSSDLAIDITGTDTSARQRSIYGEIIGYVRLAGTISTFIKPTVVNRIEISSTCSITICSGFSWSNNGLSMTIDGSGTIITGCRFSGDVTLQASMTGVFVGNLQTSGTFTNNTVSGNCTVLHDEKTFLQNGTTTTPSYSFSGDDDTGIWRRTTNVVDIATGGTTCVEFQNNRVAVGSSTPMAWVDTTTIPSATTYDTSLFRQAAGVLVAGVGGVLTASIGSICGKLFPRTDAGAQQTAAGLLGGTGAPNNANGNNGDFYFRSDGGAGTAIYQKRAGSWVGIV